jgi:hypothetical protein
VHLLGTKDLPDGWDPATDDRVTTWEVVHHLIKRLDEEGEPAAARLLASVDLSVRKLSPAANEVRPTGGSVEVSGRPGYPRRRGLDRDSVAWCTAVRPGRT